MPTSEARILANQANALRSTGPRTLEGKERSRANSCKHGLTGAGVVMPEEDAVEVERLAKALQADMKPPGEVGRLLVREMAISAVRMDRSFRRETAAISERVRTAMDEFEAPEGVDAETAEQLRVEAGKIALFDASRPACLARSYESAARRVFFRSLKDLRALNKEERSQVDGPIAQVKAAKAELLGSFSQMKATYEKVEPRPSPSVPTAPLPPVKPALRAELSTLSTGVDVPISIGRRR